MTATCPSRGASTLGVAETSGAPVAGPGAKAALLGTANRTDGSIQVTYAGHPLYYFIGSKKPGMTDGQGVSAFAARWDAVRQTGAQAD
jgi:predicted lipoprotein with Yx(FWY)xxD motif